MENKKYFRSAPYWRALRAFAYSGLRVERAITILTGCDFLRPVDVSEFEKQYEELRQEAQEIDENFQYANRTLQDLDISPIYEWVTSRGDDKKSLKVKTVSKIFDGLRQPFLRRTVDILLFVGRHAEDIAEALENKAEAPWLRWNSDHIRIYQKFFWDIDSMTIDDWREYGTWWVGKHQYPCRYVFMFPSSSVNDLLWEAGIIPDISTDTMGEIMLHECFLRFKENIKLGNESEAMNYMDNFRKMMDTMKKGSAETSAAKKRKERELDTIIDKLNVVFNPGEADRATHVDDLGKIEVSNRESVELNEKLRDE